MCSVSLLQITINYFSPTNVLTVKLLTYQSNYAVDSHSLLQHSLNQINYTSHNRPVILSLGVYQLTLFKCSFAKYTPRAYDKPRIAAMPSELTQNQ